MESHAVPVLRMGENAPPAHRRRRMTRLFAQINLNAAATARTVATKLTHGPQSIVPAMTTIAKRGKNDLPSTSLVFERSPCDRRSMLSSFPLRSSCACVRSSEEPAVPGIIWYRLQVSLASPSCMNHSTWSFCAIAYFPQKTAHRLIQLSGEVAYTIQVFGWACYQLSGIIRIRRFR
jgi:hypothetical protein